MTTSLSLAHQRKNRQTKTQHKSHLIRSLHKQNKNTNPIISRQDYHLTQPCPSEKNKQTNKLSTNLTLYKAYTNHWTNLRRAETKRKKEFNLIQRKNSAFPEAWEKETSITIRFKKVMKSQRNTAQMKEQTKSTKVQINEEEIGKLPEKNSE